MLELSAERWADLLAYCHLTEAEMPSEDIRFLKNCYWSSVAYMTQAGISSPKPETPRAAQYDNLVNAMSLDAYDHRDITIIGHVVQTNPAIRNTITQMKLSDPMLVPNSGTGR